jgi:hypothetical protein
MKRSLVIFAILMAMHGHAHAGLFEFVVTVAAAFFGGPAGNGLANFFIGLAIASYGELQAKKVRQQGRDAERAAREAYNNSLEERTITNVASDAPHVYVYGRARVGSTVVAILPGGARDEYQHIIAIHAAHECDAFEEIYIAGKALGTLNAEGFALESPEYGRVIKTNTGRVFGPSITINPEFILSTIEVYQFLPNPEGGIDIGSLVTFTMDGNNVLPDPGSGTYFIYYSYRYSSVRVKKHLGTPGEAADATLVAECPGKWTANSKLSGYCYTYIRLDLNQQEFQGGLPGIEALLRGKKLYDPRTDTTAWSQNNALVVYDYLTSEICGVPAEDIPLDALIQAADDCDDEINVGARYTFNGTVNSSEDKAQVLDRMSRSMAGGINSTTFEIWAGKWYEPTLTLEQADIVGAVAITPGESEADIVNGITGQFIGSENGYAPTDITPYQNATYLAQDGRDLFESLEFPYTDETQRCHNLARIYVEDNRNSFTVQATFSLKAWDTRIGQRITLNAAFFGFNAKVFRIIGKTYQPSGFVELLLKEDAQEIWDEADAVVVDATPNTGLPNPFQINAPASIALNSGTAELLRQADGTIVSRIKATWPSSGSVYASQAEIQIKLFNEQTWQTAAMVSSSLALAYLSPVKDGETYDVRIRFINPTLSSNSLWTQAAPHTVIGKTAAPDAPENVVVVGQQIYFTGNAGDPDLAGYILRNIPGAVSNWGAGQPLHDGFTTLIPFPLPVRLFGLQTIMVASVDTSGNISSIESVTHNFGQATLDNVVQTRDYQAEEFPGTQADCSVDAGSLVADPDPDDSIYSLPDLYSQSDVYASTYLPMVWVSEVFVPRYNGVVTLMLELEGNATIQYRYDGSTTNDLYSLGNVYAETDLYQDRDVWQAWPGALSVSRNQGLIFRISIAGGSTQGAIHEAEVFFTMNAVRQTFGSVDISASGTRLNPMDGSPQYERWVQINTLQITPFNDGSGAAYGVIQDLNEVLGPAVLVNNTSAVPVNCRATVEIGGLVDV